MATSSAIEVTFGARSSRQLEREVQCIVREIPGEGIDLVRDKGLNCAIRVVIEDMTVYYGPQAIQYLRNLLDMVKENEADELSRHPQPNPDFEEAEREFINPASVNRLEKTRYAPFAQYSAVAPTIGHHYQYVPPTFLPEEGNGFYSHPMPYALSSRYSLRAPPMHPDGRTRLPSH
ncbi:MAG: hypothetical protein WC483_02130 [Candidatus Paceibacterota bacterium]